MPDFLKTYLTSLLAGHFSFIFFFKIGLHCTYIYSQALLNCFWYHQKWKFFLLYHIILFIRFIWLCKFFSFFYVSSTQYIPCTLFRNKEVCTQWNVPEKCFKICYISCIRIHTYSFFVFHLRTTKFTFSPMNALV